jgi:hypothetical protein
MPTQTKSDPITDSVQEAAARVSEFGEQALAANKQATEAYVSSYETAVVTLADAYEQATGATKVDWVASMGSQQADATRQVVRAYASTVRELVS